MSLTEGLGAGAGRGGLKKAGGGRTNGGAIFCGGGALGWKAMGAGAGFGLKASACKDASLEAW